MRLCGLCVRSRPDRAFWWRVVAILLQRADLCDNCGGRFDRVGTVH